MSFEIRSKWVEGLKVPISFRKAKYLEIEVTLRTEEVPNHDNRGEEEEEIMQNKIEYMSINNGNVRVYFGS